MQIGRMLCGLLVLTLGLGGANAAQAQEPTLTAAGAAGGFGFAAGERWGMTQATVENPANHDAQALLAVNFHKDPDIGNVQFARDVWLPPLSRRSVVVPLRTPELKPEQRAFDMTVMLLKPGRTDRMLARQEGLLRTEGRTPMIGMLGVDDPTAELLTALRKSGTLGTEARTTSVRAHQLPPLTACWRSLDCLVLGPAANALDSQQRLALRQWLVAGGRLWIVLDHDSDEQSLALLLGDDWRISLLQRTWLERLPFKGGSMLDENGFALDAKTKLPQHWKTKAAGGAKATLSGNTLRIDAKADAAQVQMTRQIKLDPRWERLELSGRYLANKLDSGAVSLRFTFQDAQGAALGQPVAFAGETSRNWQNPQQEQDVPRGAHTLAVEIAVSGAVGQVQLQSPTVRPLGVSFAQPCRAVRVLAPAEQVLLEQDGWPLILQQDLGQGSVLVTTVEPRYWQAQLDAGANVADEVTRFLRKSTNFSLDEAVVEPFVREQIGARIIGRTPVALVLGGYVLALALAGVWLLKRDQLEKLALVGGVLAAVFALALMGLGLAKRAHTPLTIAGLQFAQVVNSQSQAVVTGVVSVFSPRADQGPLTAQAGGVLWPDRTGQQGRLLRMVWHDLDKWTWDMLELPDGAVRTSELEYVVDLPRTPSAVAEFTPTGLSVHLEGQLPGTVDDALLAGPHGKLLPRAGAQADRYEFALSDALGSGQFFGGATLSSLQQRRRLVLLDLLENNEALNAPRYPAQPTLLVWTPAFDLGFGLPQQAERRETALVALPLQFRRPPAGSTVRLLPQLLPYQAVRDASGRSSVTMFNNQSGRWIGASNTGGEFSLRFQLPTDVLPLQLQRAVLHLNLVARQREFQVFVGAERQPAQTLQSPEGVLTVELTPLNALRVDEQGGVTVRLSIGEPADLSVSSTPMWEMRELGLELEGVTR